MSAFIVNAKPLTDEEAVIAEVRRWLIEEAVKGRPNEQAVFDQKWARLQAVHYMILKALIDEGGQHVKEFSIRRKLREDYNMDNNTVEHPPRGPGEVKSGELGTTSP